MNITNTKTKKYSMQFRKVTGVNIYGETVEFHYSTHLHIQNMQLISVEITEGVLFLDCSGNKLTSLKLPTILKNLYCYNNKLTSLELPEGLLVLECQLNALASLKIPKTLKSIDCRNNKIKNLTFGFNINQIDASYNNIEHLDVPLKVIENMNLSFEGNPLFKNGEFDGAILLNRRIKIVTFSFKKTLLIEKN